ncbi:MAG: ATP-binding protein [Gammaproteobacteria bacterium]
MRKKIKPLSYQSLRMKLKSSQLNFTEINKIKSFHAVVGQERAIEALNFGIGIKSDGYNIFAMGPSGIGKRSLISRILTADAKKKSAPCDWCYIYNFDTPQKPIAISLPAGKAFIFQQEMRILVYELAINISALLESDAYQYSIKKINDKFDKKQKDDSIIKTSKFHNLIKEKNNQERKLQLKLTKLVIAPLIKKLKIKYKRFKQIIIYLKQVQADILENATDFLKLDEQTNVLTFSLENVSLTKYKVNLFVDNRGLKGAPIIYEDNPTYTNLICRVEYSSSQEHSATNFTLIRAGSLHLANNGYLVIDARKIKKNQKAWEALKNALYSHQIRIKGIEHTADIIKPISLDLQPIPLSVKVILIGERNSYYSLCQHDNDFAELFKVVVDYDDMIDRTKKNINAYARLIESIITQKKLLAFHPSAIAEIIDYSSRLAEDQEKLSMHISLIKDLVIESNYWANKNHRKIVNASHVNIALASQIYRIDRSRELYQEDITRGYTVIKTEGHVVGQVNCLSVRKVGNFSYGHPTRVTARVHFGKGKFIDIQREIKLAGPMHSKAGLIISHLLAARYWRSRAISLSASISFEQIYCWTDGDSASVGELCALLSAIARVPINQHLAITGSIDQHGKVQAVGGINEKIEGFFDICVAKGLNGQQGVLIPAINEKNLMLREDVVAAAKAKKFFIYPIKTLDQAILLLTNHKVGKRNKEGMFPEDSLNYRIEENLRMYSK